MCMLCVIPPNVLPSRSKLENSALNNPHGFGFAIVVPADKRIIVEKTMNADESINRFLELRAKYPEGYAMWHARYATHGSHTVSNCHPFAVGHDQQTYLGHNGILSVLDDKSDRSDTRIFAEDILPAMGGVTAFDNEQLFNIIEDFSAGSKLCILTVDPRAKYQCYLVHEEKGAYDETGVWWSNDSCNLSTIYDYRTTPKSYYSSNAKAYDYYSDYETEGDTWQCFNCSSEFTEAQLQMYDGGCYYCGACLDCGSIAEECMCYQSSSPAAKKRREKLANSVDSGVGSEAWASLW